MFPAFSLSLFHARTHTNVQYASTYTHFPLARSPRSFLIILFVVPIVAACHIAPNETSSRQSHYFSLSLILNSQRTLAYRLSGVISHIIVIFVSEHNAFTYDVRKLKLLYFPAATHVPHDPGIKVRKRKLLQSELF